MKTARADAALSEASHNEKILSSRELGQWRGEWAQNQAPKHTRTWAHLWSPQSRFPVPDPSVQAPSAHRSLHTCRTGDPAEEPQERIFISSPDPDCCLEIGDG